MFGMGTTELLVILGVALLLFGAKRIPEVAKSIGKSFNAFKSGLKETTDDIQNVKDDIMEQIIECAHRGTCNHGCTSVFRIVEGELQIYHRMNISLPRMCPNCRYYERLRQRNPLKLWHRTCTCRGRKSEAQSSKSETFYYKNTATHFHGEDPCPTEFETSYAPNRLEIVYCESCYNSEVA